MNALFTQMQQSTFETWQKSQTAAIEEWARLAKESLRYQAELLAAMQKQGTELTEALTPKKAG